MRLRVLAVSMLLVVIAVAADSASCCPGLEALLRAQAERLTAQEKQIAHLAAKLQALENQGSQRGEGAAMESWSMSPKGEGRMLSYSAAQCCRWTPDGACGADVTEKVHLHALTPIPATHIRARRQLNTLMCEALCRPACAVHYTP